MGQNQNWSTEQGKSLGGRTGPQPRQWLQTGARVLFEAYLLGMKGSHGSLSRASNSAGVIIV